jgi:SAM-dependent methyltransferase
VTEGFLSIVEAVAAGGPAPVYEAFAEYYDLWTELAPGTKGDVAFYVELAKTCPQGATVLELGVGTGRVAIPVARSGYRIIGVDLSPAMLERARTRAVQAGVSGQITLVCDDFTTWTPARPVELVICPYHTLSHVLDPEGRRALFRNVLRALAPGGRFVFNVLGPEAKPPTHTVAERDLAPFENFGEVDVGGARAIVRTRSMIEPGTDITHTDVEGRLVSAGEMRMSRSWSFAHARIAVAEVQGLADALGFQVVGLSGRFDEVCPPTTEQIWTLARPGGAGETA